MTKRRAKKLFIFTGIMTILALILTFVSFPIVFSINGVHYNYDSFIDKIKLGLDLKGGVSVVYKVQEDPDADNFEGSFKATIEGLTEILNNQGFAEAVVSRQGTTNIRVEVPDVDDPEEILTLLGEPAMLNFKKEDKASAENFLTGKNVTDTYSEYDSSENKWGVVVKFDSVGQRIFSEVTAELTGKDIYMYLGDTRFSSATVKAAITGGSTRITGGEITDQPTAEKYALKIKSGTLSLTLVKQSSSKISATLGEAALKYGVIAGAIGLLLIMIFMWVMYGHFGLLADLSLLIYICITIFFLQAVPFVQLTLPGIAGIILSIGMAVDANIIIFERIKDEYRTGKTFGGSVKQGFKKSVSSILDANITTILAGTCLAIFGTGPIQGFAITLLVGLVVSVFSSLVITRGLLNMYLPFNYDNASKVRMHRDETVQVVLDEA